MFDMCISKPCVFKIRVYTRVRDVTSVSRGVVSFESLLSPRRLSWPVCTHMRTHLSRTCVSRGVVSFESAPVANLRSRIPEKRNHRPRPYRRAVALSLFV